MQLTINIKNSNTVEKIVWMLEHFKSDGVEIVNQKEVLELESESYVKLNNLKTDIQDNKLLNSITNGMPKNYKYVPSDMSDKEIWYEEVKKDMNRYIKT